MALRSVRRFINLTKVTTGMMVQFGYTDAKGLYGQHVILVIDPNRKNAHGRGPQLHGFDISELTDEQIIYFLADLEVSFVIDPVERNVQLATLSSDAMYNTFTTSFSYNARPYRTFNLENIRSIRQILMGIPSDLPMPKAPVKIISVESKKELLRKISNDESIEDISEIKAQRAKELSTSAAPLERLEGESIVAFERRRRADKPI